MSTIPGTNVSATITPFDTADVYPTHDSNYGLGGWHEVATIGDRDAIPTARLRAGMVVNVVGTGAFTYNGAGWDNFSLSGTALPNPSIAKTTPVFDGTDIVWQSKSILDARDFAGANLGSKIAASLTTLQGVGGGIVDARGLTGAHQITTDIFAGITVPVTILLGATTITVSQTGASWAIAMVSNCRIIGLGSGRTIIKQANSIGASIRTIVATAVSNVEIIGVEFDGNSASNTGGGVQNHAIVFDNCDDVKVEECYIHDHNGDAIYLGSSGPLPQSIDITSITGNGTTATTVTGEAHGFSVGSKFAVYHSMQYNPGSTGYSPAGYDGSHVVVSVINSTSFTFSSTVTATAAASGLIIPINTVGEVVATGDAANLQFYFNLANTQVVPGTVALTDISGNKYVDNQLGLITGTQMTGSVDYATGRCYLQFNSGHAPAAGSITANYANGRQGFTSNFTISNNTIYKNNRTHVSIISARSGRISDNTFKQDVAFEPVHWEPDAGYEWGRDIEVCDNRFIMPGVQAYGISVGTQVDGYENVANVNIHDNTFVGGGIFAGRAPYTKIHDNVIANATIDIPIQALGRNMSIHGNLINGYASGILVDASGSGILVDCTSVNSTSGYAAGTGGNIISENIIKDVATNGITVLNSSNNLIAGNTVSNIHNIVGGSFARGISIGGNIGATNNNIIIGNRVFDNQPSPSTYYGIAVLDDATNTVVASNIATNATSLNYFDSGTGTIWKTNPGQTDTTSGSGVVGITYGGAVGGYASSILLGDGTYAPATADELFFTTGNAIRGIQFHNAANNAWMRVLYHDTGDNIIIDTANPNGALVFSISGTLVAEFDNTATTFRPFSDNVITLGTASKRFSAAYLGNMIVSVAATSVSAGSVNIGSSTATSASAGANGAVPAQVVGYLIAYVGGTEVKIPYFAV